MRPLPTGAHAPTSPPSLQEIATPLVSVVIPTYNRAAYLGDAINSALAQQYDNLEILIVDDGSTDDTQAVVSKLASKKIRYIIKEHSGVAATRNHGVKSAKGDYILWLDSDDVLLPDTVTAYLSLLKQFHDVDVVYGNLLIADDKLNVTGKFEYEDWYGRNQELIARLFMKCCLPNPGSMVRRECFQRIGMFDESFRRAEDFEWWSRLAPVANFKKAQTMVVKYRIHNTNLSSGVPNNDLSYEARIIHLMLQRYSLQELFPQIITFSQLPAQVAEGKAYLQVGHRLLQLNDIKGALKYFKLGNELCPSLEIHSLIQELINLSSSSSDNNRLTDSVVELIIQKYKLQAIIRERDQEISNFLNSRSWRLTRPLRQIKALLDKFRMRNGSLVKACKETVRSCPFRSPLIVAEALKDLLQGRSVCDVGCAEGDMLAAMAKYARKVIGFEKNPLRYRFAQERGFEVVVGDYFLDELPQAEIYYLWSDHGARDNDFIINKLLRRYDFEGLIIVGGDSNIPSEEMSVIRCAEKGKLLKIPFDEGGGYREHGIFLLAIIDAKAVRQVPANQGTERRLVVTLAVGNSLGELSALTVPSQHAFAQRIGADYQVIRKPVIDSGSPFYEIFQLYYAFDKYDRILYLDLDVIVRNNCPDLFQIVPAKDLGVFFESGFIDLAEAIRQIQEQWKPLGWSGDYFNNGVMVMSRSHRVLFKPEFELPRAVLYFDQTVINYIAQANRLSFYDIGLEFNHMLKLLKPSRFWFSRIGVKLRRLMPARILKKAFPEPLNAYMVHYAGFTYKEKLRLAARDLARWEDAAANSKPIT